MTTPTKWLAEGALVTRYGDNDDVVLELAPATDEALFLQPPGDQWPGQMNSRNRHS